MTQSSKPTISSDHYILLDVDDVVQAFKRRAWQKSERAVLTDEVWAMLKQCVGHDINGNGWIEIPLNQNQLNNMIEEYLELYNKPADQSSKGNNHEN